MREQETDPNEQVPRNESVEFNYGNDSVELCGISGEYLFEQIRRNMRFYEEDVLILLGHLSTLVENESILDAGGNIGNHTVFFAKILGQKVYTFEPIESNIEILRKNIAANELDNKVVLRPVALWSSVKRVDFHQNIEDNGGTYSGEIDMEGRWETSTIDLEVSESVSIIKVDVEGAEADVLLGALQTIERSLPIISVEIHDVQNYRKIYEILKSYSYEVIAILGRSDNYIFYSRKQATFNQAKRLVEVLNGRKLVRNTNK
ncbi:FkbM family methyltransferase [Glutamicibacter sp.]|uniref:FkbM family methyltransferase n=1 Tax=Glutamicibacter sp. TaxID=1931995 RepID=UPI002B468E07|nr:FkbM family methyltransferase [Glutamicibacter sp.]HJX80232.1 FkbM family methyltransferase [Glutamicibacter sp.]